MRVIGTAGHVDHGKSTLVAALTGIHPDRLKEEQEREMTIDLGFAWLTLPGGEVVGIVDVPGHRDFIENMLAGVGGIDAALFVVAADEGVMPQTREHLAILDILEVEGGVIALTKSDLAPDDEWLELVKEEVRRGVQGSMLEGAALVPVSAKTGAGLPELLKALDACLVERPARPDLGPPRLPVDRVFTMPGFGTVVTGTLIDGHFKVGEEIEVYPSGLRGRIRGLQSYKKKEQIASPGSRTAINISGLDVAQVRRGDVVAHPGRYRASNLLDVYFKLLKEAGGPLRHSSAVKFFSGSSEVQARVRLLGKEELAPGDEAWLQLELSDPVTVVRGDHYILRRPSPAETLGGGRVVDPFPTRRHKRFDEEALARLAALRGGAPEEVLAQAFEALGIASLQEAALKSRLGEEQVQAGLKSLLEGGLLLEMESGDVHARVDRLAVLAETWRGLSARAAAELEAFHQAAPLRRGMPREELKSRLRMNARGFQAAMRRWSAEELLEETGGVVARSGHRIRLAPQQQENAQRLLSRFAAAPYATPSVKESQAEVGEDVYQALLELGDLVQVSAEVVFRRQDYEAVLQMLRAWFMTEATLTVVQLRDRLKTSRKYALGLLEHLDAAGLTIREGDFRRWRGK